MIKDIRDLQIYEKSLSLLPDLYKFLEKLPKTEFFLINQAKRAAVSIPSNIAEGFSKRIFFKEFKRYLLISLASTDELQLHLKVISLIRPDLAVESEDLISKYKLLAKQINTTHSVCSLSREILPISSDFIRFICLMPI
jgi:four helix bundle protein